MTGIKGFIRNLDNHGGRTGLYVGENNPKLLLIKEEVKGSIECLRIAELWEFPNGYKSYWSTFNGPVRFVTEANGTRWYQNGARKNIKGQKEPQILYRDLILASNGMPLNEDNATMFHPEEMYPECKDWSCLPVDVTSGMEQILNSFCPDKREDIWQCHKSLGPVIKT